MNKNIPINKGNYSLDTNEREVEFMRKRAHGVEREFKQHRSDWETLPRSFTVADYPLLVDLELSTICNLKCPFCYTISEDFKKKVSRRLMEFTLFKKVIDEIAGKVFAIRLSLRGEPTLHPDFVEAVQYAKSKGIKEVSTLTNGSKLTPELFEQTMEAGIDWITISFDGIGAEYEKNRCPLKFRDMYERLKIFKEIKARNNCSKPVIKLQAIWPSIAHDPSEYYNTLAPLSDLMAFNPIIDFTDSVGVNDELYDTNFSCPQLYQRIVVGSDGLVMMCANDEDGDQIIGDAYRESLYSLWHGEKLNNVRELHKRPDGFKDIEVCRRCYLPRKTRDDLFQVNGRQLIVKNYVRKSTKG